MALPHYEMGVWAVNAVLARIHDPQTPAEHAVLACPLVRRESVAPPSN
jgi:LacI family transcriptional regulator